MVRVMNMGVCEKQRAKRSMEEEKGVVRKEEVL